MWILFSPVPTQMADTGTHMDSAGGDDEGSSGGQYRAEATLPGTGTMITTGILRHRWRTMLVTRNGSRSRTKAGRNPSASGEQSKNEDHNISGHIHSLTRSLKGQGHSLGISSYMPDRKSISTLKWKEKLCQCCGSWVGCCLFLPVETYCLLKHFLKEKETKKQQW